MSTQSKPRKPAKPQIRKIEIPVSANPIFLVSECDGAVDVSFYQEPVASGEDLGNEFAQIAITARSIVQKNGGHTPAWLKHERKALLKAFSEALSDAEVDSLPA